jgi:hypothetical protein
MNSVMRESGKAAASNLTYLMLPELALKATPRNWSRVSLKSQDKILWVKDVDAIIIRGPDSWWLAVWQINLRKISTTVVCSGVRD